MTKELKRNNFITMVYLFQILNAKSEIAIVSTSEKTLAKKSC